MKKTVKSLFKDTLAVILGGIIFSAGLCIFTQPHGILSGGATGVAMIVSRFLPIPVGAAIFLVNIPLFIAAVVVCGKRYTLRTAWCCLLFSAVIDIFGLAVSYRYSGDRTVCALFGGIFMGVGLYIILMRSVVTGGSDLLAYLIQRKNPALSVSTLVMIIDSAVVLVGAVILESADTALYSAMLIVVMTLTLDTLMRGRASGNVFFILSSNSEAIRKRILTELQRGVTEIDARGGYTGNGQKLIMCAVGKRQAGVVRRLIYDTDPNAFVISTNASGVYGDGFTIPKKEDIF